MKQKQPERIPNLRSWYPSMKAMAASTGIPYDVIQEAKNRGCPGFHQASRVSLPLFLKWYFGADNPDTDRDPEDWPREKDKQAAIFMTLRNQKEQRKVITLDEAQTCISELFTVCMGAVKRMAVEFPKTLEMRPAVEIKAQCDQLYREILRRATAEIEKMKT